MSNSVDNRVVQMEFDNKQFEKGVKTTLGSLDKLSKSLRLEESSKGLNELQKTADKFNLESVGKAADQAGTRFTAMQVVAFTALQRITNAAITYGKRIASALTIQMPKAGFSKYEEKMNSVQTIMFATGKSIEEVEEVLERLLTYTDETSYSFSEMSNSIGKFTSAGVDLDRAEVAMEGIANWAASAGVGISSASSAFYNMSQAISAGSMKMQDWKSIINLNMNTRQFKETAIETANEMLKLGTLTGRAASSFRSARVTVDNFEQTLAKGWLTTEVMLAVLEKYADQTTEFGLAAYHAAQEAKTFTDMVDALKDAISTGWSITWQHIFGNKEEAAEFFTNLTNRIAEFTGKISEARNKSLAFWKDKGGRDAFVESIDHLLTAFERISNIFGTSFKKVFSSLNLGKYNKIFNETFENGSIVLRKWSAEIMKSGKGYTRFGDILLDLTERFDAWTKSIIPTKDQMDKLGNVFRGVFSIFKLFYIVIDSIVRIFKPLTSGLGGLGDKVLDVSSGIGLLIEKFVNWLEENDFIYKSLKKVSDFISNIIKKIPGWIDTAVTKFEELTGLDLHTKKFESFGDALKAIVDALKTVYHAIKPMAQAVWEMIKPYKDKAWAKLEPKIESIGQKLGGFISKLVNAAKKVKAFIKGIADGTITIEDVKEKIRNVIRGIKDWWNALKNGEKTQWLTDVYETIADWAKRIKEKLQPLVDWLEEHLAGITPNKLLFGGLGVALMVFLIGIGKLTSKAGGWIGSLTDISDAITGFFKGLKTKIKLDAIRKLIIAIALLTAAIGGLAYLEKNGYNIEHAAKVLANLILLLGALGIAFAILNKINIKTKPFSLKGGLAINNFATMMLGISAAVGIMVLSLAGLEKIKSKQEDFLILGTIIATMAAVALFLSTFTNGKSMAKGGFFLLSFALSVGLIVKALDKINQETIDKVSKNLGIIVGAVFLIATIAFVASNVKAGSIISLIGVAAFIFIIFNLFKKIGELEWKDNDNLKTNVSSLLLTIALMLTGIYVLGAIMDVKKILAVTVSVGILAWSLRTIAQSFYILDKGVNGGKELIGKVILILSVVTVLMILAKLLSSGEAGVFKGLVTVSGIAAVILALTVAFLLLQKVPTGQMLLIAMDISIVLIALGIAFNIAKTIAGDIKPILGMAVAILAITAALGFLSAFGNMDNMFEVAFTLSGVIVALGGALRLASQTTKGNLGPIITLTVAIGIITAAFILLQSIKWEQLIATASAISLVLLTLGLSLSIASKSSLGISSLIGISFAVLAITASLWALSEIPFNQLVGEVIAIGGALLVMALAVKLLGNTGWTLAQVSVNMIAFAAACAAVGAAMWVVGWGFEKLIESMGPAGQTILRILEKIFGWLELVIDAIDWFIQGLRTLFDSIPSWDSIMNKLGGADNNRLPMEALDMSGAWLDAGNEMQQGTELMEDAVERAAALDTRPTRLNRAAGDSRHDRPVVTVPEPDVEQAAAVGAETQNAVIDAQIETAEARSEEVAQANMGWLETLKEKYGPDVLSFESLMSDSMGGEGMANLLSGNGMFDLTSLLDTDGFMSSLTGMMGTGGTEGAQQFVTSFSEYLNSDSVTIDGEGLASTITDSIGEAVNLKAPDVGSDVADNIISGIQSKSEDFVTSGSELVDSVITGINDKNGEIIISGAEAGAAAIVGVSSQIESAKSAGISVSMGFSNGMYGLRKLVYDTAYKIGLQAITAVKEAIHSHSPSKESAKLGGYFGEGFAIGIDNTTNEVETSGTDLAKTALGSLDSMLSVIEERMNADTIFEPTIRPVLDLTNVESGASKINSLLNADPTIAQTALGYASKTQSDMQKLVAMNELLKQNQNGTQPIVNVNVTTQELSNSTVDYLVRRVNSVLGGKI